MPLYLRPDGILGIAPSPDAGLKDQLANIERLGQNRDRLPSRLLLLDLRGQAQRYGPVENVLLAHHMTEHLQGLRVAVLVDKLVGLGQRTARTRDLDLRAFLHEDEAVEWLLEP